MNFLNSSLWQNTLQFLRDPLFSVILTVVFGLAALRVVQKLLKLLFFLAALAGFIWLIYNNRDTTINVLLYIINVLGDLIHILFNLMLLMLILLVLLAAILAGITLVRTFIDQQLTLPFSIEALKRFARLGSKPKVTNDFSAANPLESYDASSSIDKELPNDPENIDIWLLTYEAVRSGRIQDPKTIREIALNFEALANDPEACTTLQFDPDLAAQQLYKRAEQLEDIQLSLLNDEMESDWLPSRTTDENYMAGG